MQNEEKIGKLLNIEELSFESVGKGLKGRGNYVCDTQCIHDLKCQVSPFEVDSNLQVERYQLKSNCIDFCMGFDLPLSRI